MSTKRNDLAERAAAMSSRTPRQQASNTGTGGGAGAPRSKPVRLTTELEPQTYRQLTGYCTETAETIGATRVPHAVVVRALIARLESDPALRSTITDDIAQTLL
jgi:hypothetical protein